MTIASCVNLNMDSFWLGSFSGACIALLGNRPDVVFSLRVTPRTFVWVVLRCKPCVTCVVSFFFPFSLLQFIGSLEVPRPTSRVEIVACMRRIRVSKPVLWAESNLCLFFFSRRYTLDCVATACAKIMTPRCHRGSCARSLSGIHDGSFGCWSLLAVHSFSWQAFVSANTESDSFTPAVLQSFQHEVRSLDQMRSAEWKWAELIFPQW